MQVLIQVLCTRGRSLREAIGNDAALSHHALRVTRQQQSARNPGWMKIHSNDSAHGALNVEWDARAAVLVARVVTRSARRPSPIVGFFINYLLQRHRSRVQSITTAVR
jgi:hypothetical protein